MEGAWPIIFLAVVLKIPVFFGLWLVWWAVRAEPETEDAPGGSEDHGFRRWRASPRRPRGPRRGPHGGGAVRPLPDCPPTGRFRIGREREPVRVGHERRREPVPTPR